MRKPFNASFFGTQLEIDCIRIIAIVFWSFAFGVFPGHLLALEISDAPMESAIFEPPVNVMLVLDNSGSMDWEFVTPEEEGVFQGCLYLFAENTYQPVHDHGSKDGPILTPIQRRLWRSQWLGYNRIYFDPNKSYEPWPSTQRYSFGQADPNRPWSNPLHVSDDHPRIDLTADFFSIRSAGEDIHIANAHYFVHGDLNGNGLRDPNEDIYLVTWGDENNDHIIDTGGGTGGDRRRYYRLVDDGDNLVEDNELMVVVDETEKNIVRPAIINAHGHFIRFQTDREALQNFANWFTYHRRRIFMLKAAAANTITGLSQINIGLCGVNGAPQLGVRPVRLQDGGVVRDNTPLLLNALYAMQSSGRTSLRNALDRVGRYYSRDGPAGFDQPFAPEIAGDSCRRHVALVVSDGFWNGAFSGVGNADGNNGAPYADGHADTLADVAAHYYNNDLAPDTKDLTADSGCSDVAHQHMVTMTLSFGLNGTIGIWDLNGDGLQDQPGYRDDPCLSNVSGLLAWPEPTAVPGYEAGLVLSSGSGALLDDLLHAAINGRGGWYRMDEIALLKEQIRSATPQNLQQAQSRAFTLNHDLLRNTTVLYRTAYHADHWYGEVTAWGPDEDNDNPFGQLLWRASDQFQQPGLDWDRRCVITWDNVDGQLTGVPFRYHNISSPMQKLLEQGFDPHSDQTQMARDLIQFLRGAQFPHFRTRSSQLGDIVHSTPVVVGNTLFVGANDGMLHAFNTQNGQERFAYVPSQVVGHLKALSDPAYGGRHRYYVDGPLWAGEVTVATFQRRGYLVGALGKGGLGYFCLLTGTRSRSLGPDGYGDYQWSFHVDQLAAPSTEARAGQVVQWEYPRPDPANDGMDNNGSGTVDEPGETDPDIGYAFGQGYAVNANSSGDTHRPVVIFGNGYNSPGQGAVLYVLTADTGEIVRKIDTGSADDNGLSTPALIDVNRDNRVDYAYAGDLRGNMWKFDLRADDPELWGVSYGHDYDGDDVIDAASGDLPLPLFQARGQPITGRPDIMAMATACNPEADGYMVIFGTGRYLAIGDHDDTRQQSIYGIWDYGDDNDDGEHLGFILDRSNGFLSSGLRLVQQTVTGQTIVTGAATRQISQVPVTYAIVEDRTDSSQNSDPENHAGWFLDFPMVPDPNADSGERVVGKVTLRSGKAVIASIIPEQTRCKSGGSSWIYVLNGCNGHQPDESVSGFQGAKQYPGRILANPVIIKDSSKLHLDQLLVPDQADGFLMEAIVGERWGRAYWWQNID